MKEHLLALDFDGVLWDSVGECFVTARKAWEVLEGPWPPVSEAAFRRGRWLVRTGGEFGVLVRLLQEDPERDPETFGNEEFLARSAADRAFLKRFEAEFYAQRKRARSEEREAWLATQAPYPEVLQEWPSLKQEFREVVICTTKDEGSIRELLATANLKASILAKEFSLDKRDQMGFLAATRGVDPEQIVFVDDLLPNLESVAATGVRVALAGWGYNTPAVRAQARAQGIPVLQAGHVLEGLRALFGG